ncbi:MAG: EthD family reductase [Pseudomonadota bacterium]
MSVTVQAIYPITDGSTFDYDYYITTHLPLVKTHFGPHGMSAISASKGVSGGPGAPPGYFAIATMTFPDIDRLNAALAAGGPVIADLKNFTNSRAQFLIGEVLT